MHVVRLSPFAACLALSLVATPTLAWQETLETPRGLARVEGERGGDDDLRLIVDERELYRTGDWLDI